MRLLLCLIGFVVSFSLVSCSTPPAPTPVQTAGFNLQQVWSTSSVAKTDNHYLRLQPAYVAGKIYIANASGEITAMRADNGKVIWQAKTDTPIRSGVSATATRVFVGTAYGDLIAFDATTGKRVWFQSYNAGLLGRPAVAQGVVVAAALNGQVSAYRASNGHLLWNQQIINPALVLRISGSPVVSGSKLIVPMANGQLIAYRLQSGLPLWRRALANPQGDTAIEQMVDIASTPVISGNKIFVAGYQGSISSLSLASGNILWKHKFSTYSGIAVARGAVYASSRKGGVWAYSQSGQVLWKQLALKNRWAGAPTYYNGIVFVGDGYGYLYGLRARDGALVYRTKISNNPIISAPLVVGNWIYVVGTGGKLVAYKWT